jgi:hypothetical protein
LSKLSTSETIDDRKRRESNNNDSVIPAAITTMMTTTTEKKTLTPFQAQRVLLIGKLRELVINGYSPLAIPQELGISQRQYYRLRQKAFEHDCKLIEQWDNDILREDLAIYMARLQKILAVFMNMMGDPNAHDIARLKAAQLATELSNAIYRTSYEGVFQVKNQARDDIDKWDSRTPLRCYLEQNRIICHTLAQYKEAQRQFDKEQERENTTRDYDLLANADS